MGIIHMNGRVYSPSLGRMLSPDLVTQSPENGQNYNRYTYVFNNPLKYTDPSGYYGEIGWWDDKYCEEVWYSVYDTCGNYTGADRSGGNRVQSLNNLDNWSVGKAESNLLTAMIAFSGDKTTFTAEAMTPSTPIGSSYGAGSYSNSDQALNYLDYAYVALNAVVVGFAGGGAKAGLTSFIVAGATCAGATGGTCGVAIVAAAGAGVAIIGMVDGVVRIKNVLTGSDEKSPLEAFGAYIAGADGEKIAAGINFLLAAVEMTGNYAGAVNALQSGASGAPKVLEGTVDAALLFDEED